MSMNREEVFSFTCRVGALYYLLSAVWKFASMLQELISVLWLASLGIAFSWTRSDWTHAFRFSEAHVLLADLLYLFIDLAIARLLYKRGPRLRRFLFPDPVGVETVPAENAEDR